MGRLMRWPGPRRLGHGGVVNLRCGVAVVSSCLLVMTLGDKLVSVRVSDRHGGVGWPALS